MEHEVSEARKRITVVIGVVIFAAVVAIIIGSALGAS